MITVFGEGRGFRVVWLLEEMGLAYRLRPVDLLAGVEKDAEFLAINPAGFIPAIQDGDVTMVESIAIMQYVMARYGPTSLAPDPHDAAFPAYHRIPTNDWRQAQSQVQTPWRHVFPHVLFPTENFHGQSTLRPVSRSRYRLSPRLCA
jgi:glutathione S-transferase